MVLLERSFHLKAELLVALLGVCYLVDQKYTFESKVCASAVLGLMDMPTNKMDLFPAWFGAACSLMRGIGN